jgi:hypothetical protein
MNGLVCFGGVDPNGKPVFGGSTKAMRRLRLGVSRTADWPPARSLGTVLLLTVVQPSVRQSSRCTAIQAFR